MNIICTVELASYKFALTDITVKTMTPKNDSNSRIGEFNESNYFPKKICNYEWNLCYCIFSHECKNVYEIILNRKTSNSGSRIGGQSANDWTAACNQELWKKKKCQSQKNPDTFFWRKNC